MKMENRFGSVGRINHNLFIRIYTQINGFWSIKIQGKKGDEGDGVDLLRFSESENEVAREILTF
jgi:hypothetical protein